MTVREALLTPKKGSNTSNIIIALVLSIFGDDGPVPEVTLVNEASGIHVYKRDSIKEITGPIEFGALLQISMKSISLLMGEHTYQDGESTEDVKYFGILPFPDLKMDGLTYFFLVPDEAARGSARATTITILVSESNQSFLYDHMNELHNIIHETSNKISYIVPVDDFTSMMVNLLNNLNDFVKQISFPSAIKRTAKLLFAGLDNSGKTSMILGLEKKYSKLINVQPSKGVTRTYTSILGMTITAWDLAGQITYRNQYLKDAELYLFDSDLLFYLIDVKDITRQQESLDYFEQIILALRNFEENPPIIVCLHKTDPDLPQDLRENISSIKERFDAVSEGFNVRYFETTIFEPYSLITAFSYGLAVLSPNRDLFLLQLENLATATNAQSVLLLNDKGLIISNYSTNEAANQIVEMSAPYFTTLYRNFIQFSSSRASKALYTIDENLVSFHVINFEKMKLYVMLFLNDREMAETIPDHLVEFKKNVQTLLANNL
jgi:small GTP-binding protein